MTRSRPTHRFAGLAANRLRVALVLVVAVAAFCATAGPASAATFVKARQGNAHYEPRGIAVDANGHVYVGNTDLNQIEKLTADLAYRGDWGRGRLDGPDDIAVDAHGHVYVADAPNHRIEKFSAGGAFLTAWGSRGSGAGQFIDPVDIAVDAHGHVYVADRWNNRIQKFSADGAFLTTWGSQGSGNGEFRGPYRIAVDGHGNVYVTDRHRVQKFSQP
jgi:tripartite motif-containing protein 71